MFFSEDLLTSKKGSLGIIWLAATLGPRTKRITRKQLTAVDLLKSCELIAEPPEPMALRMSGMLLVGAARVYNQNYEIFYTDVTNFHTVLRRSIATDFNTTTGAGGSGATTALDLPGGGRSKFDQITFAGIDLGWETGFDWGVSYLDWSAPDRKRARRGSSKLSSLPTQQSGRQDDDEGSESDEDSNASESELGVARGPKRHKSDSLTHHRAQTRRSTAIYHCGDATDRDLHPDLELDLGQGLDLGLFDDPGDISISAPGRGFELPIEGDLGGEGDVMIMGDGFMPPRESTPVANDAMPSPARSPGGSRLQTAAKRRKQPGREDEEGSIEEVEEVIARKPKASKKVKFDESLELDDSVTKDFEENYALYMTREADAQSARNAEKDLNGRVTAMIDGAGGWMSFFDADMNSLFATISVAPTFKWQKDVAANKLGATIDADPFALGQNIDIQPNQDHDVFGPLGDQQDLMQMDQGILMQDDFQMPEYGRRRESEFNDVEIGRDAMNGSQHSQMPWEDRSFGLSDDFGGPLAGGASSITPDSRRLSILTPQEMRLRLSSHRGSTGTGQGAQNKRYRSRSASLAGSQQGGDDLMLVQDDGLDLPESLDLGITESQRKRTDARLAGLPEAFRPEHLATIERQCRDFFSYIERKMIEHAKDELSFDDMLPTKPTRKRVAATAFYNCLTLATKKLVAVDQQAHWGDITVKFAL